MATLQWTQDFAVGVGGIDDQHKELFARVNNLMDAMGQGKGKDEIGKMIKFLEDYTVRHFIDEEALMRRYLYPGYLSQKDEHSKLIKDLTDIKQGIALAGVNLTLLLQVQRRVVDWLTNHIDKMDKQIGVFLRSAAGVQAVA